METNATSATNLYSRNIMPHASPMAMYNSTTSHCCRFVMHFLAYPRRTNHITFLVTVSHPISATAPPAHKRSGSHTVRGLLSATCPTMQTVQIPRFAGTESARLRRAQHDDTEQIRFEFRTLDDEYTVQIVINNTMIRQTRAFRHPAPRRVQPVRGGSNIQF